MSKSLASIMGDPCFLRRLTDVIGQIPRQDNAAEITSIVGEVAAMLECKGAVFASFTKNDEDFESHRYIAACPASWCALYVQRRWFAIDPFLIYAQRHTEIAVGDEIPISTEGQRLFLRHAQAVGFHSIAIVPCHTPFGRSRMGVLYLASEDCTFFTRETVGVAKMCLRFIAAELLDWWSQKIRNELLERLNPRADDLSLLRLAYQGFKTKEIALLLGAKPATVDQRFARLALKLNVPSRAAAARLAHDSGLLAE